MNPDRGNATPWNEWSDKRDRSPAVWSTVTDFLRRQPEFILGGALVGGALLAYWAKNATRTAQPTYAAAAYNASDDGRAQPGLAAAAPTHQPTAQGWRRHERRRTWAQENEGPRRMPSARLGATEDQMEEMATPSTHALDSGTAGSTGAAYDLDPKSITGG